jgi:3-phosphoshikimate 1-carboxyvinyltransferase
MEKGLVLKLQGEIISRPYIALTIKMLQDFGIDVNWNDHHISIAPQAFTISDYCVESDWSAASYWYEIVALSGKESKVELLGLYRDSFQGDAKVAGLFGNLGIRTKYTDKGVELYHDQQPVSFFEYDFVNEPDLAQTFVVTCCLKKIPFRFTGLQTLRIKETDRIHALQVEMRKLGFVVSDSQDSMMEWNGETCIAEELPSIDTYEDHRMAMAFAPASLTQGKICINEPQVVSKSYPGYWKDLEQAGFSVG